MNSHPSNFILISSPQFNRSWHLKAVALPVGTPLYAADIAVNPNFAHFMTSGIASWSLL